MNNLIKQRCDLFIKSRDIMKDNFKWENSMMFPLCASIYSEKGLEINPEKIKLCKEIINTNTGLFSNFKGIARIALATMLSLEENPERKFEEILKIYEILKNEFHTSSYLPISAFIISYVSKADDYENIAAKAKEIYKKMKNEHPFLTSSEDSSFAVLFSLSDLQIDEVIEEMERCYDILKNKFFLSNSVQSLSHTLALGKESSSVKCEKVFDIFDKLKEKNHKFGTGVELSVLGLLAITTNNIDLTVNDIIEVSDYLLTHKGFGAFGIGKAQRIMYSAILVSQENKMQFSEHAMNLAAVNSITNIIIAQYAAMTAVMASSAAASASSSN